MPKPEQKEDEVEKGCAAEVLYSKKGSTAVMLAKSARNGQLRIIQVCIAMPDAARRLLAAQSEGEEAEALASAELIARERLLDEEDSRWLEVGCEMTVLPRFKGGKLKSNPDYVRLRWMKELHVLAFEVYREGGQEQGELPLLDGEIEIWAGPILVGVLDLNGVEASTRDASVGFSRWVVSSKCFASVLLVGGKHDERFYKSVNEAKKQCGKGVDVRWQEETEEIVAASEALQLCVANPESPRSLTKWAKRSNWRNVDFRYTSLIHWTHPLPSMQAIRPLLNATKFYSLWFRSDVSPPSCLADGHQQDSRKALGWTGPTSGSAYVPGMTVQLKTSTGDVSSGTVVKAYAASDQAAASYDVVLEDGRMESGLPGHKLWQGRRSSIKTAEQVKHSRLLRRGERVYARYKRGKRYSSGVVVAVDGPAQCVDIAYDSGEAESNVSLRFVRGFEKSGKLEAAEQRKRTGEVGGDPGHLQPLSEVWVVTPHDRQRYQGRVQHANNHGLTYDIMLRNGDTLQGVPRELIFPTDSPADRSSALPGRSYVDAMKDGLRSLIRRAAAEPEGAKAVRLQFQRGDVEGSGKVNGSALKRWLQQLGFMPTESEVAQVMDSLDPANQGYFDYGQLLRFALPTGVWNRRQQDVGHFNTALGRPATLALKQQVSVLQCRELWERFTEHDGENRGTTSKEAFEKVLSRSNVTIDEVHLKSILAAFSVDDLVNYRDFLLVLEHLLVDHLQDQLAPREAEEEQEDERTEQDSTHRAMKERFRLETRAATKIQAVHRGRIATKRSQQRKLCTWRLKQEVLEAGAEQEEDTIVEHFRRVLYLNTRQGSEYRRIFRICDRNCNGFLSLGEVERFLRKCQIKADPEEAAQIFACMDINEDGKVDLEDFKRFVLGEQRVHLLPKVSRGDQSACLRAMVDVIGMKELAQMSRYFAVLRKCNTPFKKIIMENLQHPAQLAEALKRLGFALSRLRMEQIAMTLCQLLQWRKKEEVVHDFQLLLKHGNALLEADKAKGEVREEVVDTPRSALGENDENDAEFASDVVRAHVHRNLPEWDFQRRKSLFWWVHAYYAVSAETRKTHSIDRLDFEIFIHRAAVPISKTEQEKLCRNMLNKTSVPNRIMTKHLVQAFNLSYSLFASGHDPNLGRPVHGFQDSHSTTPWAMARAKGKAVTGEFIVQTLGVNNARKLRAAVLAAINRGAHVDQPGWLAAAGLNGRLSPRAFSSFLQEVGVTVSKKVSAGLVDLLDAGHSGDVLLHDFADFSSVLIATNLSPQEETSQKQQRLVDLLHEALRTRPMPTLRAAFRRHAEESTDSPAGQIRVSDLHLLFQSLNLALAGVTKKDISALFDPGRSGVVSFTGFLRAVGLRESWQMRSMPLEEWKRSKDNKRLLMKMTTRARGKKLGREDVEDAVARLPKEPSREDIQICLGRLEILLSPAEISLLEPLDKFQLEAVLASLVHPPV